MPEFLKPIIDWLMELRAQAGEILIPLLPFLKVLAIILSVFFIWVIVYSVVKSNVVILKLERLVDVLGAGNLARMRSLRGWRRIQKNMKSDKMADWKTAISDADKILDDVLKMSGLQGETIDDRFNQVTDELISNANQIREAHRLRMRIEKEPELVFRKEDALAAVFIYQRAFEELKLID